jgi:peptidoglycan/xylan/chitin deacetylase (PgdA/CDA1 family)
MMGLSKTSFCPIYRLLTEPIRRHLARQFRKNNSWPGAVLFYHRVADNDLTDWTITTSGFEEQLDWLSRSAKVVSLSQIQFGQKLGRRENLEVALTFDDGYLESFQNAIPLLTKRKLPCTFFVSTGFAESGRPFPHDVDKNQNHEPVTIEMVQSIAQQGIEIGCHTVTHLDLGQAYDRQRLLFEIRDSRHKLQDWSGQAVRFFSFPYGMQWNMSQAAIDTIYESGFDGFVSAYGAWNKIGSDHFHIRRIHAFRGICHLQNWLTLDPRKIYWEPEFPFVDPTSNPALNQAQPASPMPICVPGNPTGLSSQSESLV